MAIKRVLMWLVLLGALSALMPEAQAQKFSPFMDFSEFDHDLQPFAPVELDPLSGVFEPNEGWYFTYDRVHFNVTRAEGTTAPFDGDFTSGSRIDLGYMTESQNGWLFSTTRVDSPNEFLFNGASVQVSSDGDRDPDGDGTIDPLPDGAEFLQSVNVADLSSVELNKVLRLDVLHNGGTIEPFAGIRWVKFNDFFINRSRLDVDDDTGGLTDIFGNMENNMIGGQLGARWHKRKGRWTLSSEARFFALQNFQFMNASANVTSNALDPNGDPIITSTAAQSGADTDDFVPGGEIRVEAAFEVTRSVAFRFGLEVLHLGGGVARLNSVDDAAVAVSNNDQDLTVAGLTFGVTANR